MIIRSTDASGDWEFGKGINNYKQLNNAIGQLIQNRLLLFLGDCFFAVDQGIDWFNLLGAKNQVALNLAVSATILKTEGVTALKQLSVNLDSSRRITISYEVTTIYSGNLNIGVLSSVASYLLTQQGDILLQQDGSGILAG